MSYDLLAFDPATVPKGRKRFLAWYEKLTGWAEGHDYNDPASTTSALRAWYNDMRKSYRNMNGPGAPTDEELASPDLENRLADYSFAPHAIYATFAWSEAENVYPLFRELAVKHDVGFYDVSGDEGDGEIHFPGDALRPASTGNWRAISKQFRDLKDHK
jgi:hypothetical protein